MMSSSYAAVLGKRSLDQWKVTELKEELKRRKLTIETFKSDGCKATEAYDAIASELDQSKARVNFLEELVIKLKADINKDSQNEGDLQTELNSIRSDLEAAEMRYNDEQIRTVEQLRQAFKIVEEIKSSSSHKESELMKSKYLIEELKANLMDKETELQGICEENEDLKTKLGIDLEATKAAEREAVRLEREESAQPVNEIDDEKGLLAIGKVDEVNAVQETNTGEQTSQLNEENGTNETREKATADSTIQLENVDDDSSCLQSDQVTQPLQREIENQENGIDLDCYSTLEELMEVGPEKLTKALAALGLKTGGTVQECAERLLLTKHRRLEKLDEKHFAKGSCSTEQDVNDSSKLQEQLHEQVQKVHELERKLNDKERELQALRLQIEASRIGRSGVAPTTLGNLLPITHGAVHQNTALGVEVLRSIAFGGQFVSASTMTFVASSSVASIGTSTILLLGVGNITGGVASIIYGLCVLYRDRVDQRDNYVETLGRRDRWRLHAVTAIVSCLICGLLAPLVYGLSFRESDNGLQKTLVAVGVSMTSILSMTSLKHYVGGPPRDSTLAYIFIGSNVLATVISYFFVVLFG